MEEIRRIEFTEDMRKTYKILLPNMLNLHFEILQGAMRGLGYNVELLTTDGRDIVDEGLKYVHNDTCYPALLVIGQFIAALKSGKYDPDRTALMLTQTGGGCRASNYIHLLRKALAKAGFSQVPVISLNPTGLEKNEGFRIDLKFIFLAMAGVIYGDTLTAFVNQARPYETEKGAADGLCRKWVDYLAERLKQGKDSSFFAIRKNLSLMAKDFDSLSLHKEPKVKVGIVGEIYVKYSPLANNHLEDFLHGEDCEVNVPGLLGFIQYIFDNNIEDIRLYGGKRIAKLVNLFLRRFLEGYEGMMRHALEKSGRYRAPLSHKAVRRWGEETIGLGCKMGEGWLLTAEMAALCEEGYHNIICVQPFGCLPNHIVGKGMTRSIRERFPNANIVAIDYDPGATRVNQENRVKLMLSVAREELDASSEEICEKEQKIPSTVG